MKIKLIVLGTQMPSWVTAGFEEYAKRLKLFTLELHEIPLLKRTKESDLTRILKSESQSILQMLKPHDHLIALEVTGKNDTTETLAEKLRTWIDENRDITLLIGGPEGLSNECLARANSTWSLSSLTLPHPLVRIIVAEQLYRAQSILQNHPYHRG
ncbi:MAG: 23S rRNA (pseudouridine(1915)-N(3))-methyltransferase RlmH [Gammaproteobacteria bacterium]